MVRAKFVRRLAVKRTAEGNGVSPFHDKLSIGGWLKLYNQLKTRLGAISVFETDRLANAVEALPDSFALWDRDKQSGDLQRTVSRIFWPA